MASGKLRYAKHCRAKIILAQFDSRLWRWFDSVFRTRTDRQNSVGQF